MRIGRRAARRVFLGGATTIATCRSLKSSSGDISATFLQGQVDQKTGQKVLAGKWPVENQPVSGLNFFDFEHAPIFHGRTRAIGGVLEALEGQLRAQRPFVLVVGASGSGKSSLVRAGVLPLLTQPETIEGVGLWRRAVTRPGAGGSGGDCFDALGGRVARAFCAAGLGEPGITGRDP